MKTQMQLILATIPLTALIWVYADQTSHERKTIFIAVYVMSPSPDIVPEVKEHLANQLGVRHVKIEVSGPKLALAKLESAKGLRRTYFDVNIEVPENLEPGEIYTLNIWSEVAQEVRARNMALQLRDVHPSEISYSIDRYLELDVDVELELGSFTGNVLEGPTVSPSKVTARVLQSDLQSLSSTNEPLRVPVEEELKKESLRVSIDEFRFNVSLGTKWQRINAQFKPEAVTVTAKFKQHYQQQKIVLIPLRVTCPLDWPYDQYDIALDDEANKYQAIDVQVPIGITRKPTNEDVNAYVIVDDNMLPAANGDIAAKQEPISRTREVYFHFPNEEFKDIKIIDPPRSSPRMVKLCVVKRTNGGKSAP